MNLHGRFEEIVLATLAGASVSVFSTGCSYPEGCWEPYEDTAVLSVTQGDEALDGRVDDALAALAMENPEATAAEKLLHLYEGTPRAAYGGQINPTIADLMRDAAMGGELPQDVCEAMCRASEYETFEGCSMEAPERDPPLPDGVLYCSGEKILDCGGAGRRPAGLQDEAAVEGSAEGRYWAHIAYLEQAAVHAFVRLADDLRRHGAPEALVERCVAAACDEVQHAAVTARFAALHGVRPAPVVVVPPADRDLFEIALENATEGCVRETFAGLEATWQSAHAASDVVRRAMRNIAADECAHAELSWDIHRWAMSRLDAAQRAQVERHHLAEVDALRADLAARRGDGPAAVGLPDAAEALTLLEAMTAELAIAA